MAVFYHEDNGQVLHNPGMGWVIHHDIRPNHKNSDEPDPTPELGNVALLSFWADLETQEGKYNWDNLDCSVRKWTDLGKKLQLRISTDPMILSDSVQGCPDWIYDQYHVSFQEKNIYGNAVRFPDYLNPVYREKLRSFLRALADHIGNHPALETIDLRGYGEWGEWHSGYTHDSYARHAQALRAVIDDWRSAFPTQTLELSCSYEWRHDLSLPLHSPTSYQDYLYWSAFDYALGFDNISLRRDGIGGAVKIWDTRIMQEYYASKRRRPMICEFWNGYHMKMEPEGSRGYHVEDSLEEALMLHPNYLMLMWNAVDFCNDRPDLIEYGLKRMGYRLLPVRITLPDEVQPGEAFTFCHEWVNLAAGRLCKDAIVTIHLVHENLRASTCLRNIDLGSLSENDHHTWKTPISVPSDWPEGYSSIEIAVNLADGQSVSMPFDAGQAAMVLVRRSSV